MGWPAISERSGRVAKFSEVERNGPLIIPMCIRRCSTARVPPVLTQRNAPQSRMKDWTFLGATVEDAKGAMARWLVAHEGAVVRREYDPIETPPVPGEGRTVIIGI